MEEFVRAVRVSTDERATPENRTAASKYLESVRNHADGWMFCFDAFFQPSTEDDVRFVCLQIVCDCVTNLRVPKDKLEAIKNRLVTVQDDFLPTANCSNYVKNKLVQLLLDVMRLCDATEWPKLIDVLLNSASKSPVGLDYMMRVLTMFNDTVERDISLPALKDYVSRTKDALREGSVQKLAQFWYAVITTFMDTQPSLITMTLVTMKGFISWMDIGLVANPQFIPVFFRLLMNPQFSCEACDCVAEMIKKGMDPILKVELISQLRFPDVVGAFAQATNTTQAFVERFAKLLTNAALELSFAIDKLQGMSDRVAGPMMDASQKAEAIISALFPTILSFFAAPQKEISDVSLDFLQPYVTKFKAGSFRGPVRTDYMLQILPVVLKKIAYPTNYFENRRVGGDDDEDFVESRKRVGFVFRSLLRVDPDPVAKFVEAAVTDVCSNVSIRSFSDVESALYLFFLLGENAFSPDQQQQTTNGGMGQQSMASNQTAMASGSAPDPVQRCIEPYIPRMLKMIIHGSLIQQQQHPVVLLIFFEILVRFVRLFPDGNACMSAALSAFLDTRGMRNSIPAVRRRVMYLFQKFVRTSKVLLHGYAAEILKNLQPTIALNPDVQQTYQFEDQLCVYESLGYIIGSRPKDAQALLQEFMRPLITRLSEIINGRLYTTDTPDKPLCNTLVKQHLNAVSVFSKGFALNDDIAGDASLAAPFLQVLELSIGSLGAFPNDPNIWMHVATYLHRVIDVMGCHAVSYLGLSIKQLYQQVEALVASQLQTPEAQQTFLKQIVELLSLEGQVSSRLKQRATGLCDDVIASTIMLSINVVGPPLTRVIETAPRSEEARELFDAVKQVAQCLSVITRDSPSLLVSLAEKPSPSGTGQSVLIEGFKYVNLLFQSQDSTFQRFIVRYFQLVLSTMFPTQQQSAGFDFPLPMKNAVTEFLCTNAAPAILRSIARQHLVVTESGTRKYLNDSAVFFTSFNTVVPSFAEYFGRTLLPVYITDPSTISQFVMALSQNPNVFIQGFHFLTNL